MSKVNPDHWSSRGVRVNRFETPKNLTSSISVEN
jgi:hypothetical protein